jgi:hypothetical protein
LLNPLPHSAQAGAHNTNCTVPCNIFFQEFWLFWATNPKRIFNAKTQRRKKIYPQGRRDGNFLSALTGRRPPNAMRPAGHVTQATGVAQLKTSQNLTAALQIKIMKHSRRALHENGWSLTSATTGFTNCLFFT